MSGGQPPSLDLANLLPAPRLQEGPQPAQPAVNTGTSAPLDEQAVMQRREARRERRRLTQASPGEGRNARHGSVSELDAGVTSPTHSQPLGPPQASPGGAGTDVDMSRYGLVVDTGDSPSPTGRPRRRMSSSAGGQSPSPEPRSGGGGGGASSDYGSELGSPTPARRLGSRSELRSSTDSLDSMAAAARASRRGSGFKKASSTSKAAKPPPKITFADVHFVGEIVGASGFDRPMLFCRWQLLYEPSKSWKVVRGQQQGATHACCREVSEEEEELLVWEHPLDLHLQTQSLQGWPALLLMVYSRDEGIGRDAFVSYALVPLPTTPGLHTLSCQTWFALESNRALGRSFFAWHTGLLPRLEDETFITDLRKREDAGPFICTVGAGEVHLRINVLTRNLHQVSHQGGESLAAALERLTTNILRASTQLANKSAALEERRRSSESLTEGQKLVRAGREERMASARAAIDSRRRGDGVSPAPSESSRTSMLDQRPGSFRGFPGGRPSRFGSEVAGQQDDARSEASYAPSYSGYTPPRDRYADRAARRAREKAARDAASQDGGSATPSAGGADGGGGGPSAPPSRSPSVTAAAAGAGRRGSEGDDGGSGGGDVVGGGDEAAAGRAAARAARRAQQRLQF